MLHNSGVVQTDLEYDSTSPSITCVNLRKRMYVCVFPSNNAVLGRAVFSWVVWEMQHRGRTLTEQGKEPWGRMRGRVLCLTSSQCFWQSKSTFVWPGAACGSSMLRADNTAMSPTEEVITETSPGRLKPLFCQRIGLGQKLRNFLLWLSWMYHLKPNFSFLISVTKILDWGILPQERVCKVYPFLSGLTQVNWNLNIHWWLTKKVTIAIEFLNRNAGWLRQ